MATLPVAVTILTLLLVQNSGGSQNGSSASPSHRYSQQKGNYEMCYIVNAGNTRLVVLLDRRFRDCITRTYSCLQLKCARTSICFKTASILLQYVS
jgi:hypothetical protein